MSHYEIVEHIITLADRAPLTPMPLPDGWVPMSAIRREGRVVVLMTREVDAPAPTVDGWPYATVPGKAPPTAAGGVSFGSDDQANPSTVWISTIDGTGVDHGSFFDLLDVGAVVRIAQRDNPDIWQEYLCKVSPPVVAGVVVIDDPVHWNSTGTLTVPGDVSVTARASA